MCQGGFDSRRQDPELSDIYHDEQNEPRLRDGSSPFAGKIAKGSRFSLTWCLVHLFAECSPRRVTPASGATALGSVSLGRMFAGASLPANGPDLSIGAYLQLNRIKWSGRRAIQNVSGSGIERTIVARAFETLMRTLKVDRTREVCAFLPESMEFPVERAHEDRRVIG